MNRFSRIGVYISDQVLVHLFSQVGHERRDQFCKGYVDFIKHAVSCKLVRVVGFGPGSWADKLDVPAGEVFERKFQNLAHGFMQQVSAHRLVYGFDNGLGS